MSSWKEEWNKFTPEAIEEIKEYSDQTHLHREWMSYVYEKGGQYHLGKPSYGDESRIEVNPSEKAREDSSKGLTEGERKWTIHGHPLKDGKIYNGRQYFSSVDLIDEFLEVRDSDKNGGRSRIVQYIVYPHQQKEGSKEVIHNRVRVLVFPDSKTIVKAMKQSNPSVDPFAITRDNGMNKSDSNGTTMNDMNIDWFRFQEA